MYEYVSGNPVKFVDPSGLAWVENLSPLIFPYWPEDPDQYGKKELGFLMPGEIADVDAVYGPSGAAKSCIKIPDNCTGHINGIGMLVVRCDLRQYTPYWPGRGWWPGKPQPLTPEDFQTEEFNSWPNPHTSENSNKSAFNSEKH